MTAYSERIAAATMVHRASSSFDVESTARRRGQMSAGRLTQVLLLPRPALEAERVYDNRQKNKQRKEPPTNIISSPSSYGLYVHSRFTAPRSVALMSDSSVTRLRIRPKHKDRP